MNPLVSVIVVNRNGRDFITTCLESVLGNNYPDFEVILVDNASSDGSLEYVKKNFAGNPRLRIIENAASVGPAVGRNRGIAVARGEYLAFLDNDTQVDKNWLVSLVEAMESSPGIGLAQSKLLNMEQRDRFDCAGDYLGPLGFLIERARGAKDVGQFDYIADILSAKSAASIIRRRVIDLIGGFDEDYYMYLEETDLSWRVWLAGFRVVFVPGSIVYHAFGTFRKGFKQYYSKHLVRYYGCRNYIFTLAKNLELKNLIKIMPFHIGCWLMLAIFFSLKGSLDDAFYILKGIGWNILHIGLLLKKRKLISHIRRVDDRVILEKVMDRKTAAYYLGKARAYLSGKSF